MPSSPADPQPKPSGLILVVEDDYFVATDLAAMLADSGFQVLGPVSTVEAALQLIAQHRPDAAVLDVRLRNALVTPLARALHEMRVPFVLATAYSHAALLNDDLLSRALRLGKPTQPFELVGALGGLLGQASQDAAQRPRA